MTPVVGVERSARIADWAMANEHILRWGAGAGLLGIGSFIAFAVAGPKRARR